MKQLAELHPVFFHLRQKHVRYQPLTLRINLHCSTRMAFESKLAKSSKSTDFRISPTLCTMFNVMVDAKDQSAKLCAMEMGSEVKASAGVSS